MSGRALDRSTAVRRVLGGLLVANIAVLIAKTVIPRDLQISLPALERTLEAMRASGQVSAESILAEDILFPVAPV